MFLRASHSNNVLQRWQSDDNDHIRPEFLIYPIFISNQDDFIEEIKSLPEQYSLGINKLYDYLNPKINMGLKNVLLFGSISTTKKDNNGTMADSADSPVVKAIHFIKNKWPNIQMICDICLCSYTTNGSCSINNSDNEVDYKSTIDRLVSMSVCYAKAGCHVIAPSDMTDARISFIRKALNENSFINIPIMSYSAKFASCMYGPFRNAVGNDSTVVQRPYQLPLGSKKLAMRAIERDLNEGADILMVKPAMACLDIISLVSSKFENIVIAAYQVSGEYSMIYYGAKHELFDLKRAVHESFVSIKRAGAKVIISYFTPFYLEHYNSK